MLILFFMFESPVQWLIVIVVVSLIFGANKLPELAKSLGKARKEFKKGMLEAEAEEKKVSEKTTGSVLSELDDDMIVKEIQRRQTKQLENSNQV